MRLTFRRFGFLILVIYLLFTCYSSYTLLTRKWRNFFRGANVFLRNSSENRHLGGPYLHTAHVLGRPDPLALPRAGDEPKRPISLIRQRLGGGGGGGGGGNSYQNHRHSISSTMEAVVEIWGKAAIGHFLWEHVLRGSLEERLGGIWSYGSKKIGRIKFRFRTGAGVVPEKVPRDVENLVLVLNAREPAKQQFARMWLDFATELVKTNLKNNINDETKGESSSSSSLRNVGVVILGREDCDNGWLRPYLTRSGGVVKFVFLVYDDVDLIDDVDVFQWPLGVATYRSFPRRCLATLGDEDDESDRQHRHQNSADSRLLAAGNRAARTYACNFLGTVYPNSTREELLGVLKSAPIRVQRACIVKVRSEWSPGETEATLAQYVHALTQSDLTLTPPGKNAECYRHFEAMSCGSVPVVLNETFGLGEVTKASVTNDKCDRRSSLRLFRRYGAPFIWVDNWADVPKLIAEETALSQEAKIMRRQEVMKWYRDFLKATKMKFIHVLETKFEL